MKDCIYFDEFTPLPVSPATDNAVWILYHPVAGAYILDASKRHKERGRIVTLSASEHPVNWSRRVGERMRFKKHVRRLLIATLPKPSPKGGPELLAIALQTMQGNFESGKLYLRNGRFRSSLDDCLKSLYILGRAKGTTTCLWQAACYAGPDRDIDECMAALRASDIGKRNPEELVLHDIIIWYGAYARHDGSRGKTPWAEIDHGYALIEIDDDGLENLSGHDLLEASRTIAQFYEKAAADLKLTAKELAMRCASIGITPPSLRQDHE